MSRRKQPIPVKPKPKQVLKAVPTSPLSPLFAPSGKKKVLHVGCGAIDGGRLHRSFKNDAWQEIRVDSDSSMKPDLVAGMTKFPEVPDNSMDAIWSSHQIERVYDFETVQMLTEFLRVLKPGGYVFLGTTDMQKVAEFIAKGNMNKRLYQSPSGPITPNDVLYGYGKSLEAGELHKAHKTGYTAFSLRDKLLEAGFNNLKIQRDHLNLFAIAYKVPVQKDGKPKVEIIEPDINEIMTKRDAIDREPEIWNGLSL
jgi:hypothetical protein